MQSLKITINQKTYDVEVEDVTASPMTVSVDGISYTVEVESEGAPIIAPIATAAPAGKPAAHPVAKPTPTAQPAIEVEGGLQVRSPMPGTIMDIAAKPGKKVSRGDILCALEAMKMKSMVRAPRDGEVVAVHVTDKQKVANGDLLVTLK